MNIEELERLPPELQDLALAEEELRRAKRRKLYRIFPRHGRYRRELYPKHLAFFRMGKTHRQRAFMAANRVGKTLAGLTELAYHMTGQYPSWWVGRRFTRPVRAWICGDTSKSVREGLQQKTLGDWGEMGTGLIPGDLLLTKTPKTGVPETIDTFSVRHASGGISRAEFKSYDQGRVAFQSTERDVILLDEEPPEDIYGEVLLRTATSNGIVMLTFTPLQGVSKVVANFLTNGVPLEGSITTSRALICATWDDVPHLSAEVKAELLNEIPAHMRAARTKGIPMLGSGMVFTVAEEDLICDPFDIPTHWPQGGGLDFGWDHPCAATKLAWDRDNDVIYVTADYRETHQTPALTAIALRPWGEWLPYAWPHDGLQHDKGSGEQLAKQYGSAGLAMMDERATFPDGSHGVEAGIMEMLSRMQTGKWKVFATCNYWRAEYRVYHRKDGLIVKINDDTISASRYAYMSRRYFRCKPKVSKLRINTNWRAA